MIEKHKLFDVIHKDRSITFECEDGREFRCVVLKDKALFNIADEHEPVTIDQEFSGACH